MASFKASARSLDQGVGAVLNALDEHDLADDTIVILTTDHGLAFPGAKATLTDRGLGVLLIMRGPGGFHGGRVSDSLVSQIDLYPTICELVGIERPDFLQGRSLMPLLRKETPEVNDAIFAEMTFHAAYEPQRAIRTRRWKYIRRFGDRRTPVLANIDDGPSKDLLVDHGLADRPVPEEALHDLMFDPQEAHNLVGDPSRAEVLDDMRARLAALDGGDRRPAAARAGRAAAGHVRELAGRDVGVDRAQRGAAMSTVPLVLDPDIQALLDVMNAAPGPPAHEVPFNQARAAYVSETEHLCGPGEPVAEVRDLAIPGPGGDIPLRAYRPAGEGPLPVVAYLHGGGWVMGDLDTHASLQRALANASGAIVVGVDYRLAPEHPVPGGGRRQRRRRALAARERRRARRRPGPARGRRRQRRRQPRRRRRAEAARRGAAAAADAALPGDRRRREHAVLPRVHDRPRPLRGRHAAVLERLPRRRRRRRIRTRRRCAPRTSPASPRPTC